jgi:alcohol dehydrogenase
LVRIDPPIDPQVAALFGCAVMTGVGAVVNTAGVQPGTGVAVFGLGGVGLSAVLGARASGAHPIVAVDLLDNKLAAARAAGATHVVNAGQDNAVEAVREFTGGGADYAFESVGSEKALLSAYQSTGRGGTTVTMGLPHPSRELRLSAVSLVAEERTLRGSYMGSAVPHRDIPRFIDLYRAGQLPVEQLHTHTIALDDINAGFDALAEGRAIRQVVDFS